MPCIRAPDLCDRCSMPPPVGDGCRLWQAASPSVSEFSIRTPPMAKIPPGVGPRFPQVVVLFGATGDLARRKLLPGLYHLSAAGFIPGCRIIGVSLDDIDAEAFRRIA